MDFRFFVGRWSVPYMCADRCTRPVPQSLGDGGYNILLTINTSSTVRCFKKGNISVSFLDTLTGAS